MYGPEELPLLRGFIVSRIPVHKPILPLFVARADWRCAMSDRLPILALAVVLIALTVGLLTALVIGG